MAGTPTPERDPTRATNAEGTSHDHLLRHRSARSDDRRRVGVQLARSARHRGPSWVRRNRRRRSGHRPRRAAHRQAGDGGRRDRVRRCRRRPDGRDAVLRRRLRPARGHGARTGSPTCGPGRPKYRRACAGTRAKGRSRPPRVPHPVSPSCPSRRARPTSPHLLPRSRNPTPPSSSTFRRCPTIRRNRTPSRPNPLIRTRQPTGSRAFPISNCRRPRSRNRRYPCRI